MEAGAPTSPPPPATDSGTPAPDSGPPSGGCASFGQSCMTLGCCSGYVCTGGVCGIVH